MKRILMVALAVLIAVGCCSNRQFGKMAPGTVTTIGVEEFSKVISKKKVRLIDVRTPKEYAEGHLKGAENIDVKAADFAEKTKGMKGVVAVYCARGVRSLNAANRLSEQGCTVYNLDGGINAWKQAGKPVTK